VSANTKLHHTGETTEITDDHHWSLLLTQKKHKMLMVWPARN